LIHEFIAIDAAASAAQISGENVNAFTTITFIIKTRRHSKKDSIWLKTITIMLILRVLLPELKRRHARQLVERVHEVAVILD